MSEEFDLKSIIIKFLKDNIGKEFISSQIAAWVIDKYPIKRQNKKYKQVMIEDYLMLLVKYKKEKLLL